MHRGVRAVSLDVGEQLPGREGLVQLSGLLECLQAADERREQFRKGRSLRANRNAVLSTRRKRLTAIAFHRSRSRSGSKYVARLPASWSGLSGPPRLIWRPKTAHIQTCAPHHRTASAFGPALP